MAHDRRNAIIGLGASLALALGVGWLALAGSSQVAADSFVVTSAANSGPGTLRQAILDANANPILDQITFDPTVFPAANPVTINLSTELPDIDASEGIGIDGTGAGVIIDGSGAPTFAAGLDFGPFNADIDNVILLNVTVQDFDGENIRIRGQNVTDVTIRGVRSLNSGDEGIEIAPAGELSDVLIQDVYVAGSVFETLELTPTGLIADLKVLNSEFVSSPDDSVQIAGSSITNVEVSGNTISGSQDEAISFFSQGGIVDVLVSGNTISDGNENAISVFASDTGSISGLTISDNTLTNNGAGFGGVETIFIGGPAAGPSLVANNTITGGAGDAIAISSTRVTVSRNSTFDNGQLGIDLLAPTDVTPGVTPNDPDDADSGPNMLLNFPEFPAFNPNSGAGPGTLSGTACADCTIELFIADGDPSGYGEGKDFVAETTADAGGAFSFSVCAIVAPAQLTTTATDAQGNTSEFSLNYALPADLCGTPSPTPTPAPSLIQGNVDCVLPVGAVDALQVLLDIANLATNQAPGCPQIGAQLVILWGDVNCDDAVNSIDGLFILLWVARLPYTVPAGCPAINEPLPNPS